MTPGRTFAVGGLILAVVGGVGGLIVRVVRPAPILPTTFGVGASNLVAIAVLGITWAAVGALLVVRRPANPVGRIMVVVGVALAVSVLTVAVTFAALAEGTDTGRAVASLVGGLTGLLTPMLMLLFYLPLIFPTGHGHTPRWDVMGRVFLSIGLIAGAVLVLQPGDVHLLPGIPNPVGFGPDLRPILGDRVVGAVDAIAIALLSPVWALSVASRYRAAGATERQQLKWFLAASFLTVVASTVMFVVAVLTKGPIDETPLIAFALAGTTVPVAIGIAVTRYRLYDIDRIISRTLSYGAVTAVLALVFGLVGGGLGVVLGSLAVAEGQTIAVAGSTLIVVALFGPLRRRAQTIVDRRFDRSSYDASLTVEAMTERLRDDVDLARVKADVLGVVDRTFHPATADVWLRGASR
jgi:hypothetical protein